MATNDGGAASVTDAAHEGSEVTTRDRILIEASRLFANKGYVDTSTRDIATAVGIRQPSLFYHFANKAEIFAELVSRDLELALLQIQSVTADGDEPIAAQLFAYLLMDARAISDVSTTIVGLYDGHILAEPEFATQRSLRKRLHRQTEALIRAGLATGEFSDDTSPRFVRQTITALTLSAAQSKINGEPRTKPADMATFVVRAILADQSDLADVRRRGQALWTRLHRHAR
ncbi:TetR/AcrR family transcriptional regulator [Microbacterium sp. ARD31]|uniref:TetR/AcrR family transcriptional regulator n=1 Tax=Microbacterium sp. ARD31 TaxID=2962576 RepID=UPI002882678D|nr:TetR/AcrR family transcriptional regulator [Microbacterium sp. ARD31]MDT0186053.1 TetR/AcrR family transcriptional regulator [Microbacterium sp. ARD31]